MDGVRTSGSGRLSPRHGRRRDSVRWQAAIGVAAVVAGVVTVWVTLPADFLRYHAWLAAQKQGTRVSGRVPLAAMEQVSEATEPAPDPGGVR